MFGSNTWSYSSNSEVNFALISRGSKLSGSRRTVDECFVPGIGTDGLGGGLAVGGELSPRGSGVKVARTWQKCSFRLRKCGSDERLGIRIFPATLETMRGVGHSWEADNCLTLGASVRGSKAYSESVGTSCGRSTSTNSPGQTVIDVGGERSTIARRAAGFTVAGCGDP